MTEVPSFPIRRQEPGVLPPEYENLREQGIGHVKMPTGDLAWLVTNPEYARFVLSDPRFSANKMREGFPRLSQHGLDKLKYCAPFLVNMDGTDHAETKNSIIHEFSRTRVAELRPRLQAGTDEIVDALLARPARPVDLVRELAYPVAWRMQEILLGIPTHELATMRQNMMDLLIKAETEDEEKAAAAHMHQHVADVLAGKEKHPGDDLISRLIERHRAERGEIDRYEVASLLLLFAFGVQHSTATMISLGILTLLNHAEQRAALLARPDRMTQAVDELLRYFSINDATPLRQALEDVRIGDTVIKVGEGLAVPTLPVNRDPGVCPFPHRLDLLRERPTRHLAFGHGPHRCVAYHLAPAVLEIAYTTLFQRIPTLELAVHESELAFEYHSQQAYGPSTLPVTW
ncbi:cytochrome P450 [Streptomyces sp. NPDC007983]|uniref:cytochrome P450 n=1 Tax=Streptomyces sp. NPDC007983 TaxID=3364800 RepID=UPI0036E9E0D0